MGTNPARAGLTFLILAIVPLLMAIVINFPADAGSLSVEVGPTPTVELPPADTADQPTPAETDGAEYEVILDTGIEVVGYESSISAIAIVATEPTDSAQAPPINE